MGIIQKLINTVTKDSDPKKLASPLYIGAEIFLNKLLELVTTQCEYFVETSTMRNSESC